MCMRMCVPLGDTSLTFRILSLIHTAPAANVSLRGEIVDTGIAGGIFVPVLKLKSNG